MDIPDNMSNLCLHACKQLPLGQPSGQRYIHVVQSKRRESGKRPVKDHVDREFGDTNTLSLIWKWFPDGLAPQNPHPLRSGIAGKRPDEDL